MNKHSNNNALGDPRICCDHSQCMNTNYLYVDPNFYKKFEISEPTITGDSSFLKMGEDGTIGWGNLEPNVTNTDVAELKSNFDSFFNSISPENKIYPFQSVMISEIENNKNNLVIKARQLGITDVLCRYIIWKAIFKSNTHINIVSCHSDMSQMVKNRIKKYIDSLPPIFSSFKFLNEDRNSLKFKFNNSKITFSIPSSAGDKMRGTSIDVCVVDEASFIVPDKLEHITNLYPNIKKFIFTYSVISDNKCLDIIEENISPLNVNVYRWYLVKDRNEEWKNRYIKNLGEESFRMEFECKLPEEDYD